MAIENVEKFISELVKSLHEETFVKASFGNYKGQDKHLQKLIVRLVETKKGIRLFFLYRYDTRDTAKNFDLTEGVAKIRQYIESDFFSGHLFTLNNDFQLDIGKKGKSRLNIGKPTFNVKPSILHNREKEALVNPYSFYLQALGVTTDGGKIREKQQDKWRQINKFIETLSRFFNRSNLKDKQSLKIVDMGCGKGYLTFATYDYFNNISGIKTEIIGIDTKSELVGLCNDIAKSCDFNNLRFEHGWIDNYRLENADILIALHACNTATDDAIFKGISANADLIVCSPCCHQEIRPQIKPPEMLKNVLKHGVILEREAESITDALRGILLERSGYSTKIFEFIATEHTPKNNMIIGIKQNQPVDTKSYDKQISALKEFYGIENQRLEFLLNKS